MIEPGLARIKALLRHKRYTWPAIHVAGTNGKGSICAYSSAMLRAAGLRCGRFTSPHLIEPRDSITIDDVPVTSSLFHDVLSAFHRDNSTTSIRASEFELLTATAFEIFERERVDIAVIEVGMGGRQDATNVLSNTLVTVIAKIGLDHQSWLGNTVEQIAEEKAGILKQDTPCVVDKTNQAEVLRVVEAHARRVGARPVILTPNRKSDRIWDHLPKSAFEVHQQTNLSCAVAGVELTLKKLGSSDNVLDLLPAIQRISWPGRLQMINLMSLTAREENVLLDGAHNSQSAEVLASYVDRKLRQPGRPVTWVIAVSQGKNVEEILSLLVRPGDRLAATEFGPVDGMPWVSPLPSGRILDGLDGAMYGSRSQHYHTPDVDEALKWAAETAAHGPMVVAGSLYLVSSILRSMGRSQSGEDSGDGS